MNMDAVIGCDAVEAGDAWLRLQTADHALRTVPWSAVKIAGLGGNHKGHLTIQGVTEKVTQLFDTHDSLWVVCADGDFAQVMIEKSSPKRDAILAVFERQLGTRWRGDEFTPNELTDAMMRIPMKLGGGIPKMMIVIFAIVFLCVLIAVVVGLLGKHGS